MLKKHIYLLFITVIIMTTLSGCTKTMTGEQIFTKLAPSTVEISAEGRLYSSTGSGFFIDEKGTVVTNYHVIDGCTNAQIITNDGKTYDVKSVLGYNEDLDIAILATSCKNSIPVDISTKTVVTGETVYALGSSQQLTGTFSEGIVSSSERIINGTTYIQTTAPVSNGNSGGPLVDSAGIAIGIISAGLDEGQNINFAIPIAQIYDIDCDHPVSLDTLFASNVEWLSEWQIWYEEDIDSFILVFQLEDEQEIPMSANDDIDICIVNNAGTTVYSQTKSFTEQDFDFWYYDDYTVEKYQASIIIKANDIKSSTNSNGTIYFTISGDDFYFSETELQIYGLPVLSPSINLPDLPVLLNYTGYNGEIYSTVSIENISYKIIYGNSLQMTFTGEKISESDSSYDNSTGFTWKLFDANGYLIDSSTVFLSNLDTGDKFKYTDAYSWDSITPGHTYTIRLADY